MSKWYLKWFLLPAVLFAGLIALVMFIWAFVVLPPWASVGGVLFWALVITWYIVVKRRGRNGRELGEGEAWEPWSTKERV